ncbi:MAG: hypothetical protein EPO26_06900 [Chloroflexota bacterium]|nr:MAG: hypothetical protein EPO26_06900 [Chloroflexota bacterium]
MLARGGAVLTVAHRLSTGREADRVVVLEHGRVIEEGRPDELVRPRGAFAALVELEAAGWDWRGAPGSSPSSRSMERAAGVIARGGFRWSDA